MNIKAVAWNHSMRDDWIIWYSNFTAAHAAVNRYERGEWHKIAFKIRVNFPGRTFLCSQISIVHCQYLKRYGLSAERRTPSSSAGATAKRWFGNQTIWLLLNSINLILFHSSQKKLNQLDLYEICSSAIALQAKMKWYAQTGKNALKITNGIIRWAEMATLATEQEPNADRRNFNYTETQTADIVHTRATVCI